MPTIAHPRPTRTVGVILAVAVMAATLGLAQPASSTPTRPAKPATAAGPPHTYEWVIAGGPGWSATVNLGGSVHIVFSRAVRHWLFANIAAGCKPCLLWVSTAMADDAMPVSRTFCLPFWPHWCWTVKVREPFKADLKSKLDQWWNAILYAEYIFGDCPGWQATGSRYFFHASAGCKN